jgi:hypothetical protein
MAAMLRGMTSTAEVPDDVLHLQSVLECIAPDDADMAQAVEAVNLLGEILALMPKQPWNGSSQTTSVLRPASPGRTDSCAPQ